MRKLRPREVKGLAQDQISNKLQTWELTSAFIVVRPMTFQLLVVSFLFKGIVRASGKQVTFICSPGEKSNCPYGASMQTSCN